MLSDLITERVENEMIVRIETRSLLNVDLEQPRL
jgi:hypothetical protein